MNNIDLSTRRWNDIKENKYIRCLEINISEMCNYDCEYCVFHRNIKTKKLMDVNIAQKVAKEYCTYLKGRKGVIYLGAGEPLLNWNALVAINKTVKRFSKGNIDIRFMTNASLLTEEKLEYIKTNDIKMGMSIDGPEAIQNKSRKSCNSNVNSYEVILNALEMANKREYKVYSLSATYSSSPFKSAAITVMELCEKYQVSEFDLDYDIGSLNEDDIEKISNELVDCYNIAKKKGLSMFGYWLIPFINKEIDLSARNYCGNSTCRNLCISADGQIKICGYDPRCFGDLNSFNEIIQNNDYMEVIKKYTESNNECLNCKIFPLCYGQCIFMEKSEKWALNCKLMKKVLEKMK